MTRLDHSVFWFGSRRVLLWTGSRRACAAKWHFVPGGLPAPLSSAGVHDVVLPRKPTRAEESLRHCLVIASVFRLNYRLTLTPTDTALHSLTGLQQQCPNYIEYSQQMQAARCAAAHLQCAGALARPSLAVMAWHTASKHPSSYRQDSYTNLAALPHHLPECPSPGMSTHGQLEKLSGRCGNACCSPPRLDCVHRLGVRHAELPQIHGHRRAERQVVLWQVFQVWHSVSE